MSGRTPGEVSVRRATVEDHVGVSRVLDGALLDVADVRNRLANGAVLVATAKDSAAESANRSGSGSVVGAIVVAPDGPIDRSPPAGWPDAAHVRAVAVRRKRRHAGIGSALLRAALDRWTPLVADFETDVEPFYEAIGAECSDGAAFEEGRKYVEGTESGEGTEFEGGAASGGGDDGRRWALLTEPAEQ